MIVHDVPQRSKEWAALRLGRVTGSRAADMLATIKNGESADRRNLRMQLVLERLTGHSQENGYVSKDMERGTELEADAVSAYEVETGNLTRAVGFLAHDTLLAGYSPDAVVGEFTGLIEVKCPKAATHLEYVRGGIPSKYLKQIQHGLWISGAAWCDFVSYAPDFPAHLRLKISRVQALDVDFRAYELLVRMFLAECDREVEALAGAEVA